MYAKGRILEIMRKESSLIVTFILLIGMFQFALTILPENVAASTLYVGGTGPGNYTSIQDAISVASPGSTVFVYSGTYSENIVIDKPLTVEGEDRDTTIIDSSMGLDVVYITADWVNITGFTLTNSEGYGPDAGIELFYAHDSYVANNIISYNTYAINIRYSRRGTFTNNLMIENGFRVYGTSKEEWNTHEIDLSNKVNGKPVHYWKNVTGGDIPAVAGQVILANCSDVAVENQTIHNASAGIQIGYSSGINVANNTVLDSLYGIVLEYSNGNAILYNSVIGSEFQGLLLGHASNNLVINNSVSDSQWGIFTHDSYMNTIAQNSAWYNRYGIAMHAISDDNIVESNNASFNDIDGIYTLGADDNIFANNTVSWNGQNGLTLGASDRNQVENNTLTGNERYGIYISSSTHNTLRDNKMEENGIHIHGWSVNEWNMHEIDTSNTVGGRPVYYLKNMTGGSVPPGAGQVILAKCDNVTIEFQDINNSSAGIILGYANGNVIANNTISHTYVGVDLWKSNNVTIIDNTITSNRKSGVFLTFSNNDTIVGNNLADSPKGIYMLKSTNTSLADNTMMGTGIFIMGYQSENWNSHQIDITNTVNGKPVYFWKNVTGGTVPTGAGEVILANCTNVIVRDQDIGNSTVGILVGRSSRILVTNNTVSDNYDGLAFIMGNGSSILNNTIWNSREHGMLSEGLWQGFVYHNNFINNSEQVYGDLLSSNQWDNGYPSGGNFWSDYSGTDQFSGPNQDQAGSDGIGDTPYIFDPWTEDRYPLMSPFGQIPSMPPSAPRNLVAVPSDKRVTLTWDAPSFEGSSSISNYRLYRGEAEGTETFLVEVGDVLTYEDNGLTDGQTYFYKVSAKNAAGEGPQSNGANGTPISPQPNQPPTCEIASPQQGATISGTFTITGTATDPEDSVQLVEIRVESGSWFQAFGNSTWSYEWNTSNVSNGEHTVYARSYDGENYSAEVNVTVMVDNPSPPTDQEPQDDWLWLALAVIIVIAVVILLTVFMLIRKSKKISEAEEPPEPPPEEPIEESDDKEEN